MKDETLTVQGCRWVDVPGASDVRGSVNFLEFGRLVDFQPRRVFWLHHVAPGQWRGRHGHRESELVMVALNGHCRLHLDDGTVQQAVALDSPSRALHMRPWVWHELTDFAPDTVVMVIASSLYEEAEYLRDYETFKRECGGRHR